MSHGEKISKEFFHGKISDIAQNLIGKKLVNKKNGCSGIIIETEAYLGIKDPASHLVKAGKKRQKTFSKGAGTVYVFKIYQHNNLNFLTEHQGITEGVLIRALEPADNLEKMKENRGKQDETELCSGPGKLCQALGIQKESFNGQKLPESPVSVYETDRNPEISRTPRIGISEAKRWPLRFAAEKSSHTSKTVDRKTEGPNLDSLYN